LKILKNVDIDELVEEGEGVQLEFKRKFTTAEKIVRTLIAFANTSGGCLLIGIDDDGTIIGVESEKEEIEPIYYAAQYLSYPPVEVDVQLIPYKAKRIIVVCYVQESETKPHRYIGVAKNKIRFQTGVFIRVKDKTVEASKEAVEIIKSTIGKSSLLKITMGGYEKELLSYLDAHDSITYKEYCEMFQVPPRRASRIFVRLVRAGVLELNINEKEDCYRLRAKNDNGDS